MRVFFLFALALAATTAHAQRCESGFRDIEGMCVSQPMVAYVQCVQARGGSSERSLELLKQASQDRRSGESGSRRRGRNAQPVTAQEEAAAIELIEREYSRRRIRDCRETYERTIVAARPQPAPPPPVAPAPARPGRSSCAEPPAFNDDGRCYLQAAAEARQRCDGVPTTEEYRRHICLTRSRLLEELLMVRDETVAAQFACDRQSNLAGCQAAPVKRARFTELQGIIANHTPR